MRYYDKERKIKLSTGKAIFEQSLWCKNKKLYWRYTTKSEISPIPGKDGLKFVREIMIKKYKANAHKVQETVDRYAPLLETAIIYSYYDVNYRINMCVDGSIACIVANDPCVHITYK